MNNKSIATYRIAPTRDAVCALQVVGMVGGAGTKDF